jgi:pimeloyl-ACP methyl ester carboxylesterase
MDDAALSRRTLLSATGYIASGIIGEAEAQSPESARSAAPIGRAFVEIREGLVHYRTAAPALRTMPRKKPLPLLMIHAGPGSSLGLEPLMAVLGEHRKVIAPDTLGYGDSAAPDEPEPEIAYFADSVIRTLDALKIETVDFYGAHTGAHIGCEIALRYPQRVRRLIFDGVTVRPPELRAELLAHYAPKKQPDDYGHQLQWAWQFVRDMSLFFPHYARDPEHRLANGVPSAQALHNSVVDVLKALPTYHMTYNAVYRHDIGKRLPLMTHPVLCVAKETDPNIRNLDEAAAIIPGVQKARIRRGDGAEAMAHVLATFLDA